MTNLIKGFTEVGDYYVRLIVVLHVVEEVSDKASQLEFTQLLSLKTMLKWAEDIASACMTMMLLAICAPSFCNDTCERDWR